MCQSQKINTGIKEHFKIYMVYKKRRIYNKRNDHYRLTRWGTLCTKILTTC